MGGKLYNCCSLSGENEGLMVMVGVMCAVWCVLLELVVVVPGGGVSRC